MQQLSTRLRIVNKPALNGNSEIPRFEHSDTIEIRNGIIWNFYTGTDTLCPNPELEFLDFRSLIQQSYS